MKFPKFVKDKEFVILIKGMLTKNTMKRIVKLSQVKLSDYFKDFNWDGLLSFNLEPCYNLSMPSEVNKEQFSYNDYMNVRNIFKLYFF